MGTRGLSAVQAAVATEMEAIIPSQQFLLPHDVQLRRQLQLNAHGDKWGASL